MTLIIETANQYKVLFEELAKAIGATIEVGEEDKPGDERAVLNRIQRAYKQAKADERGDTELRTLDNFLETI